MKTKPGYRGTIYSIGYQGRSIEAFLGELARNEIRVLVDLREKPFSRIPEYNQRRLSEALKDVNIEYLWMGAQLGGLTVKAAQWLGGCEKLAKICSHKCVVIMCMERDYRECHRLRLGEMLGLYHQIQVIHL